MSFRGESALVTGAASGIGLATARLLAERGVRRLVLVDRNTEALDDVHLDCEVERVAGDVSDETFWAGFDSGPIDHAVVCAGVAGAGLIADLDFAEWRRILSINLDGAFLSLKSAFNRICDGGSIVLVASAAAVKAEPGIAAYAASKAGVLQLAKVAAKEGASRSIRVNVIAPGGVETPIWDAVPMFADRAAKIGRDAAFDEMAKMATPLGRYAKAEEIAAQIAFLLSDDCATVTGAILSSDGGYTL